MFCFYTTRIEVCIRSKFWSVSRVFLSLLNSQIIEKREMADSNDMDLSDERMPSNEIKTAGQPLSDFLLQLEDYTPTVCFVATNRIVISTFLCSSISLIDRLNS